MKKVLAMSILTMIVMSMGGCGASSDSSSSQDVSSKAETESNSPYTVEADFSKGASSDFPFQQAGQMVIRSTVRGAKIT